MQPNTQLMLSRIADIDKLFASASAWGSWMVMAANEREALVDQLAKLGTHVPHRYQARCGGARTD